MPFYPTPNRDDGYDITDYLAVDPRLGDLGDVVDAIRHARDRGLRVIVDLVVNHTSDEHPWFRAARADRSSPFRDYYVWSDDPAAEKGTTPEKWTWDAEAGQFYLHSFAALPARSEHRQPRRPRRDRQDRRLLADAGRVGLPDGRRPLPRRGGRRPRRRPRRGQALAARAARVRDAPAGRGDAHGRGQRRDGRRRVLLRGSRRRAAPAAGLPDQPAAVARAGPRRRVAPGGPDPPAPGAAPRRGLGDLPAQPRRADARQARAGRARRGLRRLRA